MRLTPRYDAAPLITIDGPPDDVRAPFLRQRRRLEDALTELTDEQWMAPSRCAGWTAQDVVAHLVGTTQFWTASMRAGLAGSPTRYLAEFDPVATPALMVEPMRSMTPAETLGQLVDSTRSLCATLEPLDEAGWATTAEAPPGHLPIRLLAHHALWDAWVHERDVLLPLGIAPTEEPDEVCCSLRYVAALGPAFALALDPTRRGSLVIDATEPDVRVVVDTDGSVAVHAGSAPADAIHLTGTAVGLVEMLSIRAPLDQPVADAHRWMLGGLATVFDAADR